MLHNAGLGAERVDGIISTDELATAALAGLAAEKFLILPHPRVASYMTRKVADYDRWLGGMRRLRRELSSLKS